MAATRRTSPQTWNRIARWVITTGGVALIVAVLAILAFIAREAAPLAGRAQARVAQTTGPTAPGALLAGTDAQRELTFVVRPAEIAFFRAADGAPVERHAHDFGDSAVVTCADFDPESGLLALGTADGRAALVQVDFTETWVEGRRVIEPEVRWRGTAAVDTLGRALQHVAGDRDDDGRVALAGSAADGGPHYVLLDAEGSVLAAVDLGAELADRHPSSLTLSLDTGLLAAGSPDGTLHLWDLSDAEAPSLEDHLHASNAAVTALRVLLGDQTLVVGTSAGEVSTWFRVRYQHAVNDGTATIDLDGERLAPGEERVVLDRDYGRKFGHVPGLRFTTAGRPWTRIHDFEKHGAAVTLVAASPRSRGFVTADASGRLQLRHSTSGRTLAEVERGKGQGVVRSVCWSPKADGLVALDGAGRVHTWDVSNPHPEADAGALFGKVWYEGYVEPRWVWQSTGGSDDFEPKLSLVPLLLGTLKGTLYALVFSVPIAVLAALYLSQLAAPGLRNVVKPVIELMAAMPSVVVGFLAALWLAPMLEGHLAQVLGGLLVVPWGLAAAMGAWYLVPRPVRQRAKPGVELVFLVPFVALAAWAGTQAGGPLEAGWFGGDIKQWLFDRHGISYDQRNCIVVGVALGFAIIPIIFTIAEDAMGAVPRSLTSAALALGASRWQTAVHVILPAASPGIFAAVMLGLGRAIGETMIVLMATGNTPILDLSPFNGMRTMSAAIAVEIPEAPHGGTLYRVLFLTGFLLFVFTFLLNTCADLVGRRLRKRYGQF